MEMIIGGAYQGKSKYAKELFPEINWIDGSCCYVDDLLDCQGILQFDQLIKRCLEKEVDPMVLTDYLVHNKPDVVLVSTEVGYGIVPVDAKDRKFRECVGRVCTKLAAFSHKVTRVTCGIGMVIKDE